MKWKSLFAAALTAAVAWPALAQDATGGGTPSLSFSFANGRVQDNTVERVTVVPAGDYTSLGIESVPVKKWIDLDDEAVTTTNKAISATDVVLAGDAHAYNFELIAPVTVTYSAANGWSYKGTDTRTILQTYLDDGGTGASITVENVPFTKYDVIVYLATDNGSKFLPVAVNGTKYVGTNTGSSVAANDTATWGTTRQDYATLGTNALKVSGLRTQTLTIQGSSNSAGSGNRCGIAAFQIVQAADGALRTPSISVNMTGDQPSIVGTDGDSGLLSVPNANWNEFSSGGTSESQNRLVDNQGRLTTLAIDATYSGALWNYSSVGRPTLGDMANGYREVTTLDLATVPYSQYDLILYYASDLDGTGSKTPKPWAPVKITSGETVSYYTYTTDHTTGAALKVDEAGAANWGTTASCHDAEQSVAYGGAVMLIEGLSGDIALEMLKNDNNRGGLYGFQIVCTGELLDLVPTISVNIADVRTPNAQGGTLSNPNADVPTTGTYGLAPAPGDTWANLRPATVGADGTETITKAYACGFATPVRVSYQASGTWEYVGAEGGTPVDSFLRYYLDDGVSANGQKSGADIYVTNIPFSKYDVIVYLATDSDGEKFNPVEINGTLYKGTEAGAEEASSSTDVWGTVRQTTPALGANALRVSGLEGNLRIHGGTKQTVNSQVARGGIAAFQIVLADDGKILETVDPDRGVLSLNFNSNRNDNPGYNAVPDTDDFYGLDAVPGRAWYDSSAKYGDQGSSPIDDKTESVNVAYGSVLETAPQVTISAANGYGYTSSDPFMRAYLDDNSPGVNLSAKVPYEYYDVIVYSATDSTSSRFQAVGVNGTDYRWRDDQGKPVVAGAGELFGYGGCDAAFGQNAQRINGQTANPLTIAPRTRSGTYRSGIAAIQIIERPVQEITVDTSMTAQEVFAQSLPGRVPKLVFVEDGTITGAVNLSGVAVDLTQVASSPFTGNLTVNANTKLYLPNVRTYTLTTGSVTGTLAAGNVFVGGTAIPADAMTQEGANLTFNIEVTYNWTGKGTDTNWSTPGNWSSHAVPTAEADVSIPLAAGDKVTIELPADAVAKSVTITGPESGTATLALTSAAGETGLLTISGRMLTTGNVTVTQSADITVNGASELYQPLPGSWMPELASFQVHQATYTVTAGTLAIPNEAGDLGVSGHGTVEVSGTGTIVANRARGIYYDQNISNAQGTFRVAESGVLALAKTSSFAQLTPLKTLGGTLRATAPNVRLSLFAGLALETAPVMVEAVEGATLTLAYTGSNGALLSGSKNLTLKGPGSINFNGTVAEDYSGTVTIAKGTSATLGSARPPLAVESEAKVTVTAIDPEETGIGEIAFPTKMETIPDNVTFVVNGLEDGIEVKPAIESNQLVLKWAVEIPAMTTGGAWGTATNWDTQTVPTSGVARLDGGESGIEVTLDTALSDMESIIVSGVVSLKTTEKQSRIPASIKLEKGATLTIDAPFSGVGLGAQWELPVGTTLRVDDTDFTGWYALNMQGLVEFLPSGSAESPIRMDTDTAQFHGGLTIAGDYVQLSKIVELGGTVTLAGDNISLTGPVEEDATGNVFHCTTNTRIVNVGTGNRIYNLGGCTGTFLVNAGTLSLEVVRAPIAGLVGLVVAKDAMLTFEEACVGGQYPLSGEGTVVIAGTLRPQVKAFELGGVTYNTIPAKMVFVATKEEQTNGVIQFLNAGNATVPANFVAEVTPFGDADVWVPVATNGNPIRICNVPAPNGLSGLNDAVALALRQAAAKAGITNGDYTVQLTTKGQPVKVTADMLNDVLGCFTGLKPTADGTTLTYAYDFGVVGIKRNTTGNGWVVTAKVQGENAVQAGFAKGNYYVLSVTAGGTERNVPVPGENVNEANIGSGTVELTLTDTDLEGLTLDDGFTLGVSVSRNAQQL